jgi:flavin-dependent dehydrogenase
MLGDAAGFVNFMYQEGSNLAITSGKLCGDLDRRQEKGDYSPIPCRYMRRS